MKLKRKITHRELYFDMEKSEVHIKEHYEDVLEESWQKKVLKDFHIYLYLLAVILNVVNIIITSNKSLIVLSTTTVIFFSYSIIQRIKFLKNE